MKIEEICNNLKNFAIVAPTFNDESTFKNYIENKKSKSKALNLNNNKILEVKEVDGCILVNPRFNNQVMDENIFMYFESTDMCLNTIRKGEKIYAFLDIKFDHLGMQSSEKKYSVEIIKNRNWPY